MKKRTHERYTPKDTLQVVNSLNNESIGTVANISLGGFLLITDNASIPEGAVYQLSIRGGDTEGSSAGIDLGATCLWQAEANTPGSTWAGFQIIDISDQNERRLQDYIASLN